jgi:thiamine pyrophosphate-dependent acetolactate synthase large subunit-like protein
MAQTQEQLKDEFQVTFFLKLYKVEGYHGEHYRLNAEIQDSEKEVNVNYEHNNPEQYPISRLLENIQKMYNVLIYGGNEKLKEGAREELLKLIALLIWNVYYL